jgi:hypothetical protein
MGQHTRMRRDQRRTKLAHPAIGRQILVLDKLRLAQQSFRISASCDALFHPIECPHQVDCGRPGRAQRAQHGSEIDLLLRRHGHTPGRSDADGRRAAHGKIANGLRYLVGIAAVDPALLRRQQALVKQTQMIALPLHGADGVERGLRFCHRAIIADAIVRGRDGRLFQVQQPYASRQAAVDQLASGTTSHRMK